MISWLRSRADTPVRTKRGHSLWRCYDDVLVLIRLVAETSKLNFFLLKQEIFLQFRTAKVKFNRHSTVCSKKILLQATVS